MSKKSALITGITGFVGSYLAEELLNNNFEVYGSYLPDESFENIAHLKSLNLSKLDILNSSRCKIVIKKIKPDYIFHLAAFSSVGQSLKFEKECYKINVTGTSNIINGALELEKLKKFIFISSSEVYGLTANKFKSLKETHPVSPNSPYAVSKLIAEYACFANYKMFKFPAVVARSFNHTGPRQNINFAIPSFSKQIAEIEAGFSNPIIKVGDLSNFRDISDVRDIVKGYRKLALKGKNGEIYNLCSGKSQSLKNLLDILLSYSNTKISIKKDKSRFRKSDIPYLKGSKAKAVKELSYTSRYNLKTTLKDSLNYWRTKIADNI
ncbi:MAG: GDP-mannose 4,6-dehydratase [candidate division Zixibacteria bacterium]|nr:GDP-mannose 4,6-dehydratase [candidate division Zixibacteria bacterium]